MRKFLLLMSIGTCSCSPPARIDEPHELQSSPEPKPDDSRSRHSRESSSDPVAVVNRQTAPDQMPVEEAGVPWGGLEVTLLGTRLDEAKHAVIFLHGYGTNPSSLEQVTQLANMLEDTAVILPEAPYALGNDRYSWFAFDGAGFEESTAKVRQLLRYFETVHAETPYILGGVSQGAIMSVNLLAGASDKLEALVLLSPNNSIIYEPTKSDRRLPIFLSHGRSDPILPFAQSEKLRMQLEAWEYPVTWLPFEGGHVAPAPVALAAAKFIQQTTSSDSRN